MSNFEDKSQYEYLYDGLVNKYPAVNADGESAAFQFTGSPLNADWDTGTDIAAYDFANSVSADLDGFYSPGASSLFNAYQDLILSIQPANYTDNPEYRSQKASLSALQNQRTSLYVTIKNNYKTYKDGGGELSVTDWLNDFSGGKQYQDKLTNLNSEIDTSQKKLSAIIASMDSALAKAIENLDTDKINYTLSDSSEVKKPRISIEGNLAEDVTKWTGYGKDEYDFEVTINKDTIIKSPWHKVVKTKVSHKCFTTSVKTSVDISRIVADKNYKLDVKFKGLTSYQVKFGEWFDASYVDPGTAEFPEGGTVNKDTFFGVNGSLHMLPSQVWVAFRPQIKLTITTELYKEQYSALADASVGWLSFLGFKFDFNGESSLQPVENGDGTTTITFESPDAATPYVLGVTSQVKYDGETEAVLA